MRLSFQMRFRAMNVRDTMACTIFFLVVSGTSGAEPAPQSRFPEALTERLDAEISKQIEKKNLPGVIAVITIPGEGRYVALRGKADLKSGRAPGPDDPFRIASISKMFTATAILMLMDQGKLAATDPVAKWFPGLPHAKEITVDNLLRMQSGIVDPIDHQTMKDYYHNPLLKIPLSDLLQKTSAHADHFGAPGKKTVYTDFNYILLGEIVERVSGKDLGTYLRETILTPLGLRNTSIPSTPKLPGELRGYGWNAKTKKFEDKTDQDPQLPGGAGALVSTVADLETFARAAYKGSLLKPSTQKARLECKPLLGAPAFIQYGAGIGKFGRFYGHNGGIPGFSSEMFYLPEKDATVVICVNRNDEDERSHADGLFFKMAKLAFPQFVDW
jgi:D-alanyl-D-alanine carboxypeptidase